MPIPRTRYVRTSDGVRIAYCRFGSGPPVVFASNAFGDLHFYQSLHPHTRAMTDGLVERGWSVARYDPRGMGASDRLGFEMSAEGLIADLQTVIDRLGIGRFVLAGLGAGATLATLYAQKYSESVTQLVLLNPFRTGLPFSIDPVGRTLASATELAKDDFGFFSLLAANLLTGFANPAHARDLAAIFQASMTPKTLVSYQEALRDIDLSRIVPDLEMPTLIVHDTGFPMGSFEERELLASLMPRCRLVVIPGDGLAEINTVDTFLKAGLEVSIQGDPARDERRSGNLTPRELEVLRSIARGETNREIAESLVISERTVARHISNLYDKLSLHSKAEATAFALRNGLTYAFCAISWLLLCGKDAFLTRCGGRRLKSCCLRSAGARSIRKENGNGGRCDI